MPVHRSARVLVPEGAGLLTLALVLTSACQVPVGRLLPADAADRLPFASLLLQTGLGLLSALSFDLTSGLFLWAAGRQRNFDRPQVRGLFAFLGLAGFPLLLALGLVVVRGADPLAGLGLLGPSRWRWPLCPWWPRELWSITVSPTPQQPGSAGPRARSPLSRA